MNRILLFVLIWAFGSLFIVMVLGVANRGKFIIIKKKELLRLATLWPILLVTEISSRLYLLWDKISTGDGTDHPL